LGRSSRRARPDADATVLNLVPSREENLVSEISAGQAVSSTCPAVRLFGVVQLVAGMIGEQDAVEMEVVAATVENDTAAFFILAAV
jgi:hypothetical protein